MACTQQTQLSLIITGDVVGKSVKSFTFSKRFTQIMVRASILNIMYRRMIVNKADVKMRKHQTVPFVVFRKKTVKDPLFRVFLSWLEGIKDAIEKNYLKEIFLFMKNPKKEIVENYRFSLKYNTDKETEYKPTLIYVQEEVLALFTAIRNLENQRKLAENTTIEIEFTYHGNTPIDYEPPGFESASQPSCMNIEAFSTHLGTVNTGYHKLSCYGHLKSSKKIEDEVVNEVTKNTQEESQNVTTDLGVNNSPEVIKDVKSNKKILVLEDIKLQNDNSVIKEKRSTKFNISNITISEHCEDDMSIISIESDDIMNAGCICKLSLPIMTDIVNCSKCKATYHAPCHGFLDNNVAKQQYFCCINCGTTDQKLLTFGRDEQYKMARVRLILFFLKKDGKLPANIVESFSDKDRNEMLQKIKDLKVFFPDKRVNHEVVERLIQGFFETGDSQFLE